MSKQLRSFPSKTAHTKKSSLEAFSQQARDFQLLIRTARLGVLRTSRAFRLEETVGLAQYLPLKKAVETLHEHLGALYAIIDNTERLPNAVSPNRYPLLILLHNMSKQAGEILASLTVFRRNCLVSSSRDASLQPVIFSQARELLAGCEEIDITIGQLLDQARFLERQFLTIK